jgi:hypothetical protein
MPERPPSEADNRDGGCSHHPNDHRNHNGHVPAFRPRPDWMSSQSEEQEQIAIHRLTAWLTNLFFPPQFPLLMQAYAQEFLCLGFHSPEIIIEYFQEDDIVDWHWMQPGHRCVFLARIHTFEAWILDPFP